jgi:hypothetical protein
VKGQHRLVSGATEIYVSYGMTQRLFEACSAQANYKIPQTSQNVEIPRAPSGEDLGVGEGWWYESMLTISLHVSHRGYRILVLLVDYSYGLYQLISIHPNSFRSWSASYIFNLVAGDIPTHVSSDGAFTSSAVSRQCPNALATSTRSLLPPRGRPHGCHARNLQPNYS